MFLDADEQEEQEAEARQPSASTGADNATLSNTDSAEDSSTVADVPATPQVEQEA